MTYLEQLPRCTDCDRILRTKDGRPWCIDCLVFCDETAAE